MKFKIFTITLSFVFLLSPLLHSQAEPKKKFLVLGFQSKLINDLQDRLIREELMRELVKSGYNIVPVMELESAAYDENAPLKDFRNIKEPAAVSLANRFNAKYVLFGKIYTKNKSVNSISAGKKFNCSLRFYSVEKKKFTDISFEIDGSEKFYDFTVAISKKCMIEISEKIKEM